MPGTDRGRRLMLPVILAAFFIYGFDANVVNVAIPSFERELHAGQAALELIVGGYVFTYAAGLVTGGRLGDLFGHRRMFLGGMAGFVVASVLCGLATTAAWLVGARMLQGFTAAAMVPQVLALVTSVFPPEERSRALAWYGVTGGLSGICGQVLGGLLLVANVFDLGWRAIFFLNVPVGAVVLVAAVRLLPRTEPGRRPTLDFVGVLGVSGSLALALVPLVLGRDVGWPVWAWALLVLSVPAMTLAVRWERGLARKGGQPLLDVTLFSGRVFRTGLAVNAAFMLSFGSSIFVLSILLQNGMGLSALAAGLSFAPMAVVAMGASFAGRVLVARYGLRVLTLGCAITGLSMLLCALQLSFVDGGGAEGWLVASLTLMGLGNGLIMPSLIGAPLAEIPPTRAGVASGMLATTQQFANVTGVAVVGALFFTTLGTHPSRGGYAHAAGVALWIVLGFVLTMAILIQVLAHASEARKPELVESPVHSSRR